MHCQLHVGPSDVSTRMLLFLSIISSALRHSSPYEFHSLSTRTAISLQRKPTLFEIMKKFAVVLKMQIRCVRVKIEIIFCSFT